METCLYCVGVESQLGLLQSILLHEFFRDLERHVVKRILLHPSSISDTKFQSVAEMWALRLADRLEFLH